MRGVESTLISLPLSSSADGRVTATRGMMHLDCGNTLPWCGKYILSFLSHANISPLSGVAGGSITRQSNERLGGLRFRLSMYIVGLILLAAYRKS